MAPGDRNEPPNADESFLRNAHGRRTNLLPFLFVADIRTGSSSDRVSERPGVMVIQRGDPVATALTIV